MSVGILDHESRPSEADKILYSVYKYDTALKIPLLYVWFRLYASVVAIGLGA